MDGIERKRDDQDRSRNYRLATIWDLNMGRRFDDDSKYRLRPPTKILYFSYLCLKFVKVIELGQHSRFL